jgi:hypothetical protein
MTQTLEVTHLAREIKTALELAIAGQAPAAVIDRLAVVAGLLDAFTSLALDETATPLFLTSVERGKDALAEWHRWRQTHRLPTG